MPNKIPKPRGRPRVPTPKEPLSILLDPDYIEYLKDIAGGGNIQDMLRTALYTKFPNPYLPSWEEPNGDRFQAAIAAAKKKRGLG